MFEKSLDFGGIILLWMQDFEENSRRSWGLTCLKQPRLVGI